LVYVSSWTDRRKDRSFRDHPGTLLQDCPCRRSSVVLSQMDDQDGSNYAMDPGILHSCHPSNYSNRSDARTMPKTGTVGDRIWSEGKNVAL